MRMLRLVSAATVLATLATGCSWAPPNDAEKERLKRENGMLAKKVQTLDNENQILNSLLQTEKVDRKKAEELLAANQKYVASLQQLFASIETDGVEQTTTGVRISDGLLFDSGSTSLKEGGKGVLGKLARQIVEQKLKIRVDGHTDGQPIVRVKDKYETNWDLSAARALTVLKYLGSQGVPEADMSASAFGEYHPVAGEEGSGAKPNKRNRRVEITVLKPMMGGE